MLNPETRSCPIENLFNIEPTATSIAKLPQTQTPPPVSSPVAIANPIIIPPDSNTNGKGLSTGWWIVIGVGGVALLIYLLKRKKNKEETK